MKIPYYFFLLLLCTQPIVGHSQQMGEWFNQKKTQIRYLAKQIAELKIYLGYVKRGYNIVSGGLKTIKNIKNGEFQLHDLYYKSLGLVNPRIRNAPKAKGIINHQLYILKAAEAMNKLLESDHTLPASLKTYAGESVSRLLEDVEKVRKSQVELMTDNEMKLTDDERLKRLDLLFDYSKSQFVFAQKFSSEVITLIQSIRQEQRDEQILKKLHGLQ